MSQIPINNCLPVKNIITLLISNRTLGSQTGDLDLARYHIRLVAYPSLHTHWYVAYPHIFLMSFTNESLYFPPWKQNGQCEANSSLTLSE